MKQLYKSIVKPLLFNLDAERAHHFVFDNLRRAARLPGAKSLLRGLYSYRHPSLAREVFGLNFPNPVGLAAGFDKNAALTDELATLGFSFVEIGTAPDMFLDGKPRTGGHGWQSVARHQRQTGQIEAQPNCIAHRTRVENVVDDGE